MEPPTPEDEFEFYFQKAAKNKNLARVERADEAVPRRGSLPTTVQRIQLDEDTEVIVSNEYHHHRTSSCKNSNKNTVQPVHHSPSTRASSAKRCSYSDAKPAASGNGFLSPLSAAGETTMTSISAPQSRSGSFRKTTASGTTKESQEPEAGNSSDDRRRSSVYLEDTVAAKIRELKDLENENCLVVRQFTISPKGDIINRVDSFKKKRDPSPKAPAPQQKQQQQQQPRPVQLAVPGYDLKVPGKQSSLPRLLSCDRLHRVLVIGDRGVGKTALITQFMTSEYLAALDTSFDGDTSNDKTISVSVDGEEMTLQFSDLEPDKQQVHRKMQPDVDCYLLVYSIAERKSFTYTSSLLRDLNEIKRTFAVIVVANKSDVVRKRQVPDEEAMDLCAKCSAKFIEVSAGLNHKVDELLVGIVNQIRLNPKRRQRLEQGNLPDESPTPTSTPCAKGPRSFFSKLFSKKNESRPCENLQTL